jgi:hypothetical protein
MNLQMDMLMTRHLFSRVQCELENAMHFPLRLARAVLLCVAMFTDLYRLNYAEKPALRDQS